MWRMSRFGWSRRTRSLITRRSHGFASGIRTALAGLFSGVLKLCARGGLGERGVIAIDGSKLTRERVAALV